MYGSVRRLQRHFPIDDILFYPGDIRDQVANCEIVQNRAKIVTFWAANFGGKEDPKFLIQLYKVQWASNM